MEAMSLHRASRESFGHLPDGRRVERIWLRNKVGCAVGIITYGAAIQALCVPDRDGNVADIVLGHDDLAGYVATRNFFGATIGRYANRIADGAFTLDGVVYRLSTNDARNSLHGGVDGFDRKLWSVEAIDDGPRPSVTLSHISPHGDEGYPGTLHARVTYALTDEYEVRLVFEATTDRPTIVNLAHHGFFNLAGVKTGGDVMDHQLTIQADEFLPVDADAIPRGDPASVEDTPFDFRRPHEIGARIRQSQPQLVLGQGYDHNFCLRGGRTPMPRLAARVEHAASGRVMQISTDQPGLQFYSGNFLNGSTSGKFGRLYRQSDGLCLEPQCWPDTPNRAEYSSARLDPGETYTSRSIYRFSTA